MRLRLFSLAALTFLIISPGFAASLLLPTDVTILTQKDFIADNIFSVADALRGVPSLKIEQDGSRGTRARPKMRGLSESDNVMVLLDGRPLTHEYDSDVDLTQFPIAMVDRIEITRGGSSLLYGSEAVGGTINIITSRPEQKGLVADLGTGVGRDGEKNSIGKIFGRSYVGDITYTPSLESSSGFMQNEDFDTTNHFANFTRSFNGKGYWGLEYYYHESEVGLSNGTPVPFEDWNAHIEQQSSTPDLQLTQESQHAKVFIASPLMMGGTTYAAFTQSWRGSDTRATPGGVSLRDEDSRASIFDLSWRADHLDVGVQTKDLKRHIFPEDSHYAYQNGVFINGKWGDNALSIVPGLRYDHHSRSGGFLAPRLAVVLKPGSDILLSATVQRAHRVPNFDELYSSGTITNNPNLDDEKSVNSDVGVGWTPTKWFTLKTTGFYIRKKDLIIADANAIYHNDGTERSKGLETEWSLRVGPKKPTYFELTGNWTAQRAERSTTNNPTYEEAAMSPRNLAFARLDLHLPKKILISNELRYQSDEFELDNRQGVKIPGFYVWNARFAIKILAADMYFSVDNLTRRRYAEAFGEMPLSGGGTATVLAPQPERTFWTGVSIRFIN